MCNVRLGFEMSIPTVLIFVYVARVTGTHKIVSQVSNCNRCFFFHNDFNSRNARSFWCWFTHCGILSIERKRLSKKLQNLNFGTTRDLRF